MLKGIRILADIFGQSGQIDLAFTGPRLIRLKALESAAKPGPPNPETLRDLLKAQPFFLSNRQNMATKIY